MSHYSTTDRRISTWDLRRLFNEGGFEIQAERGTLTVRIETRSIIDEAKSKTLTNVPAGSKSQYVYYLDSSGNTVVEFHRYLKPDGTIGASGKHDPKRITLKGVTYHQPRKSHAKPARLTNKEINHILDKRGLAAMMTYLRGWKGHLRHLIYRIKKRGNPTGI